MIYTMPNQEPDGIRTNMLIFEMLICIMFMVVLVFFKDSPRNLIIKVSNKEAFEILNNYYVKLDDDYLNEIQTELLISESNPIDMNDNNDKFYSTAYTGDFDDTNLEDTPLFKNKKEWLYDRLNNKIKDEICAGVNFEANPWVLMWSKKYIARTIIFIISIFSMYAMRDGIFATQNLILDQLDKAYDTTTENSLNYKGLIICLFMATSVLLIGFIADFKSIGRKIIFCF